MTLKTWKKEFYPITAKQAARGSVIKAVEHSLRKWEGLRKSNLRAHGMVASDFWTEIVEKENLNNSLQISSESCSLCQKFVDATGSCNGCPLYETRGQVRCDRPTPDEQEVDDTSVYSHFSMDQNPIPMIRALRKALTWAKNRYS